MSRRLKLKNLRQCEGLSGGAAIELLARGGNSEAFPLPKIMMQHNNCDFSFGGVLETYLRYAADEEQKQGKTAVKMVVSEEC